MDKQKQATGYQLFMLVLSVYAIAILGAEASGRLEPETIEILEVSDFAVCVLFFLDFLINLARAENRTRYFFTWGWIDLLSSIPAFEVGRIGRVFRIFRVFRIIRGVRLFHSLWHRRAENALLAAGLASIMLITFASIAVLSFENTPDANIKTPYDAVWWAVSTLTTVGYGDRFPVTAGGRLVAVAIMGLGLGLLGTFSAFLAAWFLGGKQEDLTHKEIAALRHELKQLREDTMAELRRLQPELEKTRD